MSNEPMAGLLRSEGAFGLLGEAFKRGLVFDGQVGEDLAIEFDAGFLEAADEPGVAEAVGLGGGADADDPERAELALALLATGVSELEAALDGLFGGAVEFGFCQEITAGAVEDFFPLGAALGSTFYARHGLLLFRFVMLAAGGKDRLATMTSSHAEAQ